MTTMLLPSEAELREEFARSEWAARTSYDNAMRVEAIRIALFAAIKNAAAWPPSKPAARPSNTTRFRNERLFHSDDSSALPDFCVLPSDPQAQRALYYCTNMQRSVQGSLSVNFRHHGCPTLR